jgi:phenylpyruvate tautomerase PptA (4-oxalocrotonate tautomerase family)
MPSTLIETRAGWVLSPEAVISAVHSAVAEALKLPDWDRTVRLVEHAKTHFPPPPGRGERYTLVEISLFKGRSIEAKRALYQGVVAGLEALGVPPSDVTITLIEVAAENWGVRGGQPASEVDLGFRIDV